MACVLHLVKCKRLHVAVFSTFAKYRFYLAKRSFGKAATECGGRGHLDSYSSSVHLWLKSTAIQSFQVGLLAMTLALIMHKNSAMLIIANALLLPQVTKSMASF